MAAGTLFDTVMTAGFDDIAASPVPLVAITVSVPTAMPVTWPNTESTVAIAVFFDV
jgi:hypothetical protein